MNPSILRALASTAREIGGDGCRASDGFAVSRRLIGPSIDASARDPITAITDSNRSEGD